MTSCDVLIVGGGPAGSTCAGELVRAGVDVALIDRAAFPRDKVCAGWITPTVVHALRPDLADYASGRTLQPFTGFRTASLSMASRTTKSRLTTFPDVVSYGVRRCEFDAYLLERSGVRCLEPQPVQQIERDGDEWIVNGEIRARLLVGAGGHFCPVSRAINHDLPEGAIVAAQEVEMEMTDDQHADCAVDPSSPELFFWPDLEGYGWCVRKGRFLNLGAGRLSPTALPAAMREFGALLRMRRAILPDRDVRWKGHAYLLNRTSRRRLWCDGAVLIGDAAGLALAPSGEGILAAVESGLIAGRSIVETQGNYSASGLVRYGLRIVQRFGGRAKDGTARVPRWLVSAVSRTVLGLPWLRRRWLLEDAFLHRRRPELYGVDSLLPMPSWAPTHVRGSG